MTLRNKKGQFIKGARFPSQWIEKTRKARTGTRMSPEAKTKLRLAHLGKKKGPMPEWHKKKISESHKKAGVGKWMTGRRIPQSSIAKRVAKMKGRKRPPFSEEWKRKIGLASKGRKPTLEAKRNHHIAIMKFIRTPEYRQKQRLLHLGEKSANWRGGLTPLKVLIRESKSYEHWRKTIYERDSYTCQLCNKYGGAMHVDHFPITFSEILYTYGIKTYLQAMDCKKFWDTDNGRVLCEKCHKATDTWGYKNRNKNYETAR